MSTSTPSTPGKTQKTFTTVKFSLDNPFYQWPEILPMDHQILISKLTDLKASISAEEWKAACVLDPNELMRELECAKLAVVFAFKNDLRYPLAVAHLPFMCRQSGAALVEMKAGAAQELNAFLLVKKPEVFMFALKSGICTAIDRFSEQFPKVAPVDPSILPAIEIKKTH